MRDYDQAQKIAGIGAGPDMAITAESAGYAVLGQQQLAAGSPGPQPDPMWLPIGDLLVRFKHQSQQIRAMQIENSSLKLRVAELEHSRTLSGG